MSYENKSIPKKRVVFVILDEFDNSLSLNENLEYFKKLKSQSVFGNNFYSPGPSTLRSMPVYLTGLKNHTITATKRKREIFLSDNNKKIIKLNYNNSIFSKIEYGYKNSIILGGALPLCLYFKGIECIDDMNYIYSPEVLFATKLFINDFFHKVRINYKFNLSNVGDFRSYNQLQNLLQVVKRFDKNFAFIHLHLPHLPQDFVFEDILKIYKNNLKKADTAINQILTDLIDTPVEQDYLLIITSDHWVGQLSVEEKPVPFVLKLKNDISKI